MTNDMFNCHKCKNQKRPPAQIEKYRQLKGCFGISEKPLYTFEELKFTTCVGNFYLPEFNYLWTLFTQYKKGNLPYSCALSAHPAKLVEIMNMLYNLEVQYKNEQQEKALKEKR